MSHFPLPVPNKGHTQQRWWPSQPFFLVSGSHSSFSVTIHFSEARWDWQLPIVKKLKENWGFKSWAVTELLGWARQPVREQEAEEGTPRRSLKSPPHGFCQLHQERCVHNGRWIGGKGISSGQGQGDWQYAIFAWSLINIKYREVTPIVFPRHFYHINMFLSSFAFCQRSALWQGTGLRSQGPNVRISNKRRFSSWTSQKHRDQYASIRIFYYYSFSGDCIDSGLSLSESHSNIAVDVINMHRQMTAASSLKTS